MARSIKFEEFEVGLTILNRQGKVECSNENNGKRENKTKDEANREDKTGKEGVYENQYDNNNQQRSKETCLFDHLPNEKIA